MTIRVKETESVTKNTGTLWGITTFFNPAGCKNKKGNYDKFRESSKKQGLKLVAVELEFGNRPFELSSNDAEILIQIRGDDDNIMWQKERLLNVGLTRLPKDCNKVAWLDCDIIFENNDWIEETTKLLDEYTVVQPFEYVSLLNKKDGFRLEKKKTPGHGEGEIAMSRTATALIPKELRPPEGKNGGHPGFAWAIRKEVIESAGFYDRTPIFGADNLMYYGFSGEFEKAKNYLSPKMFEDYEKWAQKIYPQTKNKIFYCKGMLFHIWHGRKKNRGYEQDNRILLKHDFNPKTDIYIDDRNIWRWSIDKSEACKEVTEYFHERNEDDSLLKLYTSDFKHDIGLLYRKIARQIDVLFMTLDGLAGRIGTYLRKKTPRLFSIAKKIFPDGYFNLSDRRNKRLYSKIDKKNQSLYPKKGGIIMVKGIYGLGNRIYSILMALVYSKLTGRKIVIDWTDGMYADQGKDAFSLLFTGLKSINSHDQYKNMSIYPDIWEKRVDKSVFDVATELGDESDFPDPRNILSGNYSRDDYKTDILILFDYLFKPFLFNPILASKKMDRITNDKNTLSRLIENNLFLKDNIKREVDEFVQSNFRKEMIGVHVRQTDNQLAHFSIWNKGVAVRKIETILDEVISDNKEAGIFLSTDNEKVLNEFEKKYKNVLHLEKFYDSEDSRPIHSSKKCLDKAEMAKHAIMDMYLLARCNYLIYSSKSTFAKIATVLSQTPDRNLIDADPQEL